MSAPRRTLTVPSRFGAVTVTYRPNDIVMSDYDHAETDPHGTAARLIVSCVARWGIIDAVSGERWPINLRGVRDLQAHDKGKLVLDIAMAIANAERVRLTELTSDQQRMRA